MKLYHLETAGELCVDDHLTRCLMDKLLSCLNMWCLVTFVLDVLEENLIRIDLHKCLAERSKPVYLHEGGH